MCLRETGSVDPTEGAACAQRDGECRPAQGAACASEMPSVDPLRGRHVCARSGAPQQLCSGRACRTRDEQAVLRDAVTEREQGRVLAGSAAASASGPGIRKAVGEWPVSLTFPGAEATVPALSGVPGKAWSSSASRKRGRHSARFPGASCCFSGERLEHSRR